MQVKTKLMEVPVGKNFKVFGREYTKLAGNDRACFALQASNECSMPFQTNDGREDRNNFAKSEIRSFLKGEYISRLRAAGMKDGDVLPLTVNLKCTLGQHEYGSVDVMAGLLTLEQYGEFFDIIPKDVDDWWWLATPWATPLRSPYTNYTTNAWLVYSSGDYYDNNCTDTLGVRPALNLNSSLLVSWECEDGSMDADGKTWSDYVKYLLWWAATHADDCYTGDSPNSYGEWLDGESDDEDDCEDDE